MSTVHCKLTLLLLTGENVLRCLHYIRKKYLLFYTDTKGNISQY